MRALPILLHLGTKSVRVKDKTLCFHARLELRVACVYFTQFSRDFVTKPRVSLQLLLLCPGAQL